MSQQQQQTPSSSSQPEESQYGSQGFYPSAPPFQPDQDIVFPIEFNSNNNNNSSRIQLPPPPAYLFTPQLASPPLYTPSPFPAATEEQTTTTLITASVEVTAATTATTAVRPAPSSTSTSIHKPQQPPQQQQHSLLTMFEKYGNVKAAPNASAAVYSEQQLLSSQGIRDLTNNLVDDSKAGVRILCLDGGGTRGLLTCQILRKLEKKAGKRIYDMFDVICGSSTGGIIALAIGLAKLTAKDCRKLYIQLKDKVFGKKNALPIPAFFDGSSLEKILKELGDGQAGTTPMWQFSPKTGPAVFVTSTVTNSAQPETFLFRNYEYKPGVVPTYAGSSEYMLWEAGRATSAAPAYFTPLTTKSPIDGTSLLHIDGGVGENNPTGIALAESKLLFGKLSKVKCVVSIGTGLYSKPVMNVGHVISTAIHSSKSQSKSTRLEQPRGSPTGSGSGGSSSAAQLLGKNLLSVFSGVAGQAMDVWRLIETLQLLVACTTSTETTHKFVQTLLDSSRIKYFRLNPSLSAMYDLSEIDPYKLNILRQDTKQYIKENAELFTTVLDTLNQEQVDFGAKSTPVQEQTNIIF